MKTAGQRRDDGRRGKVLCVLILRGIGADVAMIAFCGGRWADRAIRIATGKRMPKP